MICRQVSDKYGGNQGTWPSAPAEKTDRWSGEAASARTSALCRVCTWIRVPCLPSQNWVLPLLSPLTMLPSLNHQSSMLIPPLLTYAALQNIGPTGSYMGLVQGNMWPNSKITSKKDHEYNNLLNKKPNQTSAKVGTLKPTSPRYKNLMHSPCPQYQLWFCKLHDCWQYPSIVYTCLTKHNSHEHQEISILTVNGKQNQVKKFLFMSRKNSR
jgi:hypothetical protein